MKPPLLAALALALAACQTDPNTDVTTTPDPGTPGAGAEQVRIGSVAWYVDYEAAVAAAREADKPLWVHFGEDPG